MVCVTLNVWDELELTVSFYSNVIFFCRFFLNLCVPYNSV